MKIQEDVPLAPFTTLQVGGNARYFAEPVSDDEVIETLRWARARSIPAFVLGGGCELRGRGAPRGEAEGSAVVFPSPKQTQMACARRPGPLLFPSESPAAQAQSGEPAILRRREATLAC